MHKCSKTSRQKSRLLTADLTEWTSIKIMTNNKNKKLGVSEILDNGSEHLCLEHYLCDLAKAGGVNGSILGDGHCVPPLILRLVSPATSWSVRAPAPHAPSHSSSSAVFLGQELLLNFNLFPVFLHLCLLVDLVNCFRTLVSSTRHPVILWIRDGRCFNISSFNIYIQDFQVRHNPQ